MPSGQTTGNGPSPSSSVARTCSTHTVFSKIDRQWWPRPPSPGPTRNPPQTTQHLGIICTSSCSPDPALAPNVCAQPCSSAAVWFRARTEHALLGYHCKSLHGFGRFGEKRRLSCVVKDQVKSGCLDWQSRYLGDELVERKDLRHGSQIWASVWPFAVADSVLFLLGRVGWHGWCC